MEGLGRLQEVIARARTRCVFSQQNTHSNRIFFIRGLVRPSDRRALARQPESNSTITHRLPACPPQGISSCSACFLLRRQPVTECHLIRQSFFYLQSLSQFRTKEILHG